MYALILILSAYAATADAQDSILAATSATPNPSSTEKITFSEVNVDGPYIAMTLDDGPHATNTPKLLEMAAKRHIKLTFFVLGECVEQNPDVLRREVAEGHEIGNHSWSHPNLAKLSDADVRSQLQRTEDIIVKTAGTKPKLMRPPYGELTKRQRILVNHELGYKVILWDVDPLDWKRPGSNIVAQRIIAGARPGSIICHMTSTRQRSQLCPKFLTPFSQRDSNSSPSPSCSPWTKAASENRRNDAAGFSTEEASVTIRFDLTSFADKIYKWCEASELLNLHNATTLRHCGLRFLRITFPCRGSFG
jgi:peptidoglycan/xylan/chitin deacetylase (PgdA/CDA1 family)